MLPVDVAPDDVETMDRVDCGVCRTRSECVFVTVTPGRNAAVDALGAYGVKLKYSALVMDS